MIPAMQTLPATLGSHTQVLALFLETSESWDLAEVKGQVNIVGKTLLVDTGTPGIAVWDLALPHAVAP